MDKTMKDKKWKGIVSNLLMEIDTEQSIESR